VTIRSEELNAELLADVGEFSYVAAFPGTFVSHTEEEARATAKKFTSGASNIGRPLFIYRIEVIAVVVPEPPEEVSRA
jgi:hypothetical protein